MTRLVIIASAVLPLTIAWAQAPNTPEEPVIRIDVNVIQVDAVVTDSKGSPVSGLTAADFEILQDGKPQPISDFSYVAAAAIRRVSAPAAGDIPVASPALTPADVRRTVALVVDDLNLSIESMVQVREALRKFVDDEMQPGDLIAILRTGSGMGVLQQFTADKAILDGAIGRLKYNASGVERQLLERPASELNEFFTVGTLGALRFAVNGLGEMPGRKSLVLFSENLPVLKRAQELNYPILNSPVVEDLQHVADAANRAGVAIYTIDPRGLQYYGLTAADNGPANPLAGLAAEQQSRDGLAILADETGGLFVHNTNDLVGAVRKALDDSSYYLIGYHPNAATFDPKTGAITFHRLVVRVKRPGLHVRTRTGFFGTAKPDRAPPAGRGLILRAMRSPFAASDIHVRLTPLFENDRTAGSFLRTMLYLDARDLKFTNDPDGWHKAVFDFMAATYGEDGLAMDVTNKRYTMRAKGRTFEMALSNGLVYSIDHSVQKPGAYQLRVAVRDVSTDRIGSASQFVEVPDLAREGLTLSSILLNEQAPPGGKPDPMANPAIRIFKPGATLTYTCEVLTSKARSDRKHIPNLSVQTILYRDGKQVFASQPQAVDTGKWSDGKRLPISESLRLGTDREKGDYILQLIVMDDLAHDHRRTAAQSIDFEIAP